MVAGLGDLWERTTSKIQATRSIVSPLQWALVIILPVGLSGIIFGPADYRLVFMLFLILFPVAHFYLIYTYWGFKEPDRLHTEEHREHMTKLSTYRDSSGAVIEGTAVNVAPPPEIAAPVPQVVATPPVPAPGSAEQTPVPPAGPAGGNVS
jgi:hypothetical protein